jgi:hypothetical protein
LLTLKVIFRKQILQRPGNRWVYDDKWVSGVSVRRIVEEWDWEKRMLNCGLCHWWC